MTRKQRVGGYSVQDDKIILIQFSTNRRGRLTLKNAVSYFVGHQVNLKKNIPTNICTCDIKQNLCITSYYPTVSLIQIKTSPRVERCDKAACIYNVCVCVCRKGAPSDAQGQFGITQCSTKAIWQAQGGGGTSEAAWDKAGQDRVERGRAGEWRV